MVSTPHFATMTTAWICVLFYLLAVTSRIVSGRARENLFFRVWWSVACLSLAVHIAAAFHFEHGWSHAAALKHTAEKTRTTVGLNWGGGLYFNWLLLVLWTFDVALTWLERCSRWPLTQTHRLHLVSEAYCGFMMFNAAIVFGPVGRWLQRFVLACS